MPYKQIKSQNLIQQIICWSASKTNLKSGFSLESNLEN